MSGIARFAPENPRVEVQTSLREPVQRVPLAQNSDVLTNKPESRERINMRELVGHFLFFRR